MRPSCRFLILFLLSCNYCLCVQDVLLLCHHTTPQVASTSISTLGIVGHKISITFVIPTHSQSLHRHRDPLTARPSSVGRTGGEVEEGIHYSGDEGGGRRNVPEYLNPEEKNFDSPIYYPAPWTSIYLFSPGSSSLLVFFLEHLFLSPPLNPANNLFPI